MKKNEGIGGCCAAFLIIALYFLPITLLIVESFFTYLSEETGLNPNDYARITDVEYKAVVVDEPDSEGKVIVTERLTYDIHAADYYNRFWELWRDLPEAYIDGVKVDYKVNSVKQVYDSGPDTIYEKSPKLYWDDDDYTNTANGYGPEKWYHSKGPYNESQRRYECVFFYVNGIYRDEVTFEIEYEMSNAALRYNDCSELYLCMYSESTINHLNSFKGEILFPNEKMPSEGNYWAHTYGTNENDFSFTESSTKNPGYYTFSFELDEEDLKFKPYNEYIEFSLVSFGDDKHIFTEYASENDYYYDDVLEELKDEQEKYEDAPMQFAILKVIVFIGILALTPSVLNYSTKAFEKLKKKHFFYEPSMQMDYFRDIPSNLDPTFASALVFCKDQYSKDFKEEYSALILSLVRKGYIELEKIDPFKDWDSNNVKIVVKYEPSKLKFAQEALESCKIALEQAKLTAAPDFFDSPVEDYTTSPLQDLVQDSLEEQRNENLLKIEDLEKRLAAQENLVNSYTLELEKFEPLTLTEEYYFNLIYKHSHGIEISMRSFEYRVSTDYENTDDFVRKMENSITNVGISQGYFTKFDYEQPKKEMKSLSTRFKVYGFLILILVNLISYQTRLDLAFGAFFVLGIAFLISSKRIKQMSKKCVLLTQFGEDEYVKWRGLYNFLNSETLINERTVIELPLWEQYLVYATAFGISDKVIKALNIRCPEANMSPVLRNPYYRSTSFRTSTRSFRSTTRSTSHSFRSGSYYSGYGGHGGYGGGGRGGGGGRRRSLIL